MTPFQLDLLRVTLHELRREPALPASLFYQRLFARHPRLLPRFGARHDLDGKRLFWILGAVIAGLSDPQRFVGLLTLLAQPEVSEYLSDRECMAALGEALQCMLERGLGEFYVTEVHEAWQGAYERFASAAAALVPERAAL